MHNTIPARIDKPFFFLRAAGRKRCAVSAEAGIDGRALYWYHAGCAGAGLVPGMGTSRWSCGYGPTAAASFCRTL